MDYKTELNNIEKKINFNKEEKIKLQERKHRLELDKAEILKQLEEEGIKSEELENLILDLEVEIQQNLEKCKEVLR